MKHHQYNVGDLIEIWSCSDRRFAPGTILEMVTPGKLVIDRGHPVPVGCIKVEYKSGPTAFSCACKWVLPQDTHQFLRLPKRDPKLTFSARGRNDRVSKTSTSALPLCKMSCGRYVQPGLTRLLNPYDSCCKKCAQGRHEHDPNCAGQTVRQLKTPKKQDGNCWNAKFIQSLIDDQDNLSEQIRKAMSNFGHGGEISENNFSAFLDWLAYKTCSKPFGDAEAKSLYGKYASSTGVDFARLTKFMQVHLKHAFNELYGSHKVTVRRAMLVRKNPKPVNSVYQFGKKIGEGSFGKVYLVQHHITSEKRVCKEINKANSSVPIEQILAEIKIMSELDHPNVLKLYEFFDTPTVLYMIMEVCSGGELLARIKKPKKSDDKEQGKDVWIHDTIKQTLRALSFMHDRRIAHKDLKPENILYQDTNSNSIKVIDFGLAEWFRQSQRQSDLQCGTPLYCAPEIFSNSPFDFRVDIWSLGVIMFYMIEGVLPFMGTTLSEVKGKVCSPDKPPIPRCNRLMQDLCAQMLTKSDTLRPTAPRCLTHKWFQFMGSSEKTLSAGIVQSLQNFNQQPELKKAIYFLIAHNCQMPQLEQIRQLFTSLDEANDGTLNQGTLRDVLVRAGLDHSEATSIVHHMSRNGHQLGEAIHYTEFIAATISVRVAKDAAHVDYAFGVFDRNSKGSLSMDDFAYVFGDDHGKGDKQLYKALADAFHEIDGEQTGKISKKMFHAYMKKLGKMGQGNAFHAAGAFL